MMRAFVPAVLMGLAAAGAASGQNVHINPTNSFIAQAVKVPAGSETLYVSGITPDPIAPAAAGAQPQFGDTKAQTISALSKIQAIMKAQGYELSDTVMMRVLLVGDPAKGGKMDFQGMMAGYNQFFGPIANKPARITSQVAALANPALLVEIEVQAAKAPGPAKK
jgi:enamine deaminase RidA (YjgF/YER057c/UK114 family)